MTVQPDPQFVQAIARTAIGVVTRDGVCGRFVEAALAEHGVNDRDLDTWGALYDAAMAAVTTATVSASWLREQEPDHGTAAGRLRALWNATCDPHLVMGEQEVADVATVLDERDAAIERVAELETEREADTRAVRDLLMALIVLGNRWPAGLERRVDRLRDRYADRIAALGTEDVA